MSFKKISSKSNCITFYRSLGMHNQVATQKKQFQATSIQQNSMHYLSRGGGRGSENNRLKTNSNQIQFYHVL